MTKIIVTTGIMYKLQFVIIQYLISQLIFVKYFTVKIDKREGS